MDNASKNEATARCLTPFETASSQVHVNDLHATILHLTAVGHLKLTYRLNGRNFRLTDVAGRVLKEVVG